MLTFSVTVSDTSDTFLVATSENFQPTSFTVLVNFEAPIEKADQLYNYQKNIKSRFLKSEIFLKLKLSFILKSNLHLLIH